MRALLTALGLLPRSSPAHRRRPLPPPILLRIGLAKRFTQSQTLLLSSDKAFTVQDSVTGQALLHGTPGVIYKATVVTHGWVRVTRDEPGGDLSRARTATRPFPRSPTATASSRSPAWTASMRPSGVTTGGR